MIKTFRPVVKLTGSLLCISSILFGDAFASATVCQAKLVNGDTPGACFSQQMRQKLQGTTTVEVSATHELFYILMALTETGRANAGLIAKDSPYYSQVLSHFGRFKNDDAVRAVESLLSPEMGRHMEPKINASAYEFTRAGEISKQRQYTQIRGQADNFAPFAILLTQFAKKTDFMGFYRSKTAQRAYAEAVAFYKTEANVSQMSAWLKKHFPAVLPYDHVRIVVSPLIGGWQHQDIVVDGKFRELILHVNAVKQTAPANRASPASNLKKSYILFTELNHGSINPTAKRYAEEITKALGPRMSEFGADASKSEYNTPELLLLEYLNWGLIPLFACDTLPAEDCEPFKELTLRQMASRGEFLRYPEFQSFLVDLYQKRPNTQTTVADLFPKIIEWFAKANLATPKTE